MMTQEIQLGEVTFRVEATLFGPSDLAEISGMPMQITRLWRSRGLLPEQPRGRSRYSARDIAEIMLRYDLSRLGVPPSESLEIAVSAAEMVIWFALLNCDGTCEVTGEAEAVEKFMVAFDRNEKLVDSISGTANAFQFLVSVPPHKPEFVAEIDDLFQSRSVRAAMLIDLSQVALDLGKNARCPLFSVRQLDQSKNAVRRLTGHRTPRLRLVRTD